APNAHRLHHRRRGLHGHAHHVGPDEARPRPARCRGHRRRRRCSAALLPRPRAARSRRRRRSPGRYRAEAARRRGRHRPGRLLHRRDHTAPTNAGPGPRPHRPAGDNARHLDRGARAQARRMTSYDPAPPPLSPARGSMRGTSRTMLALLFDIHGNLLALDAVLEDARAHGADRWLLGGDYAVFGGWPAETIARLRALPNATWIRGNVDRWAATEAPDFELAKSGVAACREALDADVIAALGALAESADLGRGTRAWHASPKSDMRSF